MELAVYNIKGEDTGRKVTLNDEIFAIAEPNEHAVYLDVKQYMANKRQGTHKAKERSEIAGSTKKLGRQKGGGGARHGDIKSPLFHGGGRVFGPRPRNYGFKLNKKVKALASRTSSLMLPRPRNLSTLPATSSSRARSCCSSWLARSATSSCHCATCPPQVW